MSETYIPKSQLAVNTYASVKVLLGIFSNDLIMLVSVNTKAFLLTFLSTLLYIRRIFYLVASSCGALMFSSTRSDITRLLIPPGSARFDLGSVDGFVR